MQDGAAVTGLAIAAASLVAVNRTGNAIYDPIGSIIVGNLLGMVCNASSLSIYMEQICQKNILLYQENNVITFIICQSKDEIKQNL